jgi:hypothetical protein
MNRPSKRKLSFPSSDETQLGTDVSSTSPWHGNSSEYTKNWLVDDSAFLILSEEQEAVSDNLQASGFPQRSTGFTLSTLRDGSGCSTRPRCSQALEGSANSQRAEAGKVLCNPEFNTMQGKFDQREVGLLSPSARSQRSATEDFYKSGRGAQLKRSSFASASSSPDSFDEICRMTNKRIVSESLLQIYHDSMENALSCWLTEKTCPYETEGIAEVSSLSQESMSSEWGYKFSNRISTRVRNLDRASCSLRDRPLTPAEDRAASRAFDAATMAFAAQWSHLSSTGPASRVTKASSSFPSGSESLTFTTENGPSDSRGLFDRSVQEHLWHNARRILLETSDVDSFKVSFAHIIFAFTQRPLDMQKHSDTARVRTQETPSNSASTLETPCSLSSDTLSGQMTASDDSYPLFTTSNSDDLERLINLEGPPVFLESALRQLYTWRHRLEGLNSAKRAGLGDQDRKTFNLLFWLGVMLETLSAAMNNRPLVVSDEESAILGPTNYKLGPRNEGTLDLSDGSPPGHPSSKKTASSPWGELFLRPKHRSSQPVIRWPCLYEDAAQALCNAAPVKVLLFRKVTTLQTLVYRCAKPVQLEEAIQDALDVYAHWNSTYGPLILDFIASHEALPPRLQSWYVVLTGHWHLAVFLLADLIEMIDSQSHSLKSHRQLRQSINFFLQIRKQSAFEIAEIAEVSSPNTDSSFYRTSAFHDHLNQGALLTEPWTDILIRSFGKACCLFLDWLQSSQNQPPEHRHFLSGKVYASCASCIKGLRELGRKSDMARLVAMTFAPRLQQLHGSVGSFSAMYNNHTEYTSPVAV